MAAELAVPDPLAAAPERVGAFLAGAFGKFGPLDEFGDGLALMAELEAVARIGGRLDVIGLQPVIGVDIVGVFADDRPTMWMGAMP